MATIAATIATTTMRKQHKRTIGLQHLNSHIIYILLIVYRCFHSCSRFRFVRIIGVLGGIEDPGIGDIATEGAFEGPREAVGSEPAGLICSWEGSASTGRDPRG